MGFNSGLKGLKGKRKVSYNRTFVIDFIRVYFTETDGERTDIVNKCQIHALLARYISETNGLKPSFETYLNSILKIYISGSFLCNQINNASV